ncbi:hypothetical protein F4776DRAFT_663836 [Hypoxylon sp. NC0597]|nr:hypothetical protein F4776DRAFT_663836 [Hypoxylon sp. NC0597]
MKFFAITAFVTAVLAAPYVVDPTNATDPMDTTGTTNSTGTVDPTSSWNTTDPTDPTSSWNTTDPTDPKSSWNSTDPTVPTKPWNSTDNTWTCKPISYICKPDFSGWTAEIVLPKPSASTSITYLTASSQRWQERQVGQRRYW